MGIWAWALIFCASLGVLVVAANMFINAAERIGKTLGMPPFLIGVLLVGFGTSLPELVSSIMAVHAGSSKIVVGNVLGSNVTNIFLILGIAGVVGGTFTVKIDLLKFDIPVMIGAAFVLSLMISNGRFSLGEGIICLMMLSIYLTVMLSGNEGTAESSPAEPATLRTWAILLTSVVGIFLGAKYTVESIIEIAKIVNIAVETIAMSAVALGTSLPEIVVAIAAIRKGQPEIVIGNVVGSNIFNTFAVMGIPALIGPIAIPEGVLDFSVPVFLAATMMHVFVTVDKRVTKAEGAFLLCFYLFFIGRLFNWM